MADLASWQHLPELELLAQIAAHEDITFRIRGSLADRLIHLNEVPPSAPESSLYNFVAPFSDIDVLTKDSPAAALLHTRIKEVVPGARFFYWEIQTDETLTRYHGLSNIVLSGQPEILFRRKQKDGVEGMTDVTHIVEYCRSSGDLTVRPLSAKTLQAELQLDRASDILQILLDFLYVARRFPKILEDEARDIVTLIRQRASAIKSLNRRAARRLLFPCLKFLFHNSERKLRDIPWTDLSQLLGEEVIQELNKISDDPLWTRLIDLCETQSWSQPIIAVVSPTLGAQGTWERQIHDVFLGRIHHPSMREASRLLERSGASGFVGLSSPLVMVPTGKPPSPGCCKFRDFARGITEVGWIPPEGDSYEPPSSMAAVFMESEDPIAVQTRLSLGPTRSFRLDYNLLSIFNGAPRSVGVAVISRRDET